MDSLDQELDAIESLYFESTRNKILNSESSHKDSNEQFLTQKNNQKISEIEELSFIEKSCADVEDTKLIEMMLGEHAGDCCLMKCNSKISKFLITNARDSFMELSKSEQDLVILA
ncbi:hypothetical protein ABEB36_014503 [Hypothenemus hampei]|uniref:Uncharacterized protein n=1 Tax=Hypothenemus hampei TaxID=57062 RepID=A0ABD1E4Q8_HYPHA